MHLLSNLRLSTKLTFGFGLLTFVALGLGALGYYGASRNASSISDIGIVRMPAVEAVLNLKEAITSVKSVQRTLLQRDIAVSVRQRQYELAAQAEKTLEAKKNEYAKLPRTPEEAVLWKEFITNWEAWHKGNQEFTRLSKELDVLDIGDPVQLERNLATFRGQHYQLQLNIMKCCSGAPLFEGGEDGTACAFGKWKAAQKIGNPDIATALKEIELFHSNFHAAAKRAKERIREGDFEAAKRTVAEEMEPQAKQTFERFDRMQKTAVTAIGLFEKLNYQAMEVCRVPQLKATEVLERLAGMNMSVGGSETRSAREFSALFKKICLAAVFAGVILAVTLTVSITRSITRPIRAVANVLAEGSEQVATAATQVSGSSQSLAEGASEQAASLEETSASMEELSSITSRNAESARKANHFAREAHAAADTGAADMRAMNQAMYAIKASSDDIAKIIKTIDEIAFQTNILALNAAVEAARAGDAGMGFAVVADEVRNLAQRCAESAKETANKIEAAISRTSQGADLSVKVAAGLQDILAHVQKVDELAAEVASASNEQSTGISQVSAAVSQMDKVTQANAASAEESASASEEMNAQAEQLRIAVKELVRLVDGSARPSTRLSPADHAQPRKPAPARSKHRKAEPVLTGSTRD